MNRTRLLFLSLVLEYGHMERTSLLVTCVHLLHFKKNTEGTDSRTVYLFTFFPSVGSQGFFFTRTSLYVAVSGNEVEFA